MSTAVLLLPGVLAALGLSVPGGTAAVSLPPLRGGLVDHAAEAVHGHHGGVAVEPAAGPNAHRQREPDRLGTLAAMNARRGQRRTRVVRQSSRMV